MKLTRASSYALHTVAYMAMQKKDEPTASHVIAAKKGIPKRFLLKVLKPLVSARVLTSVKGPNGGYRLARSPADITLLEVLEAVDGPIRGHAPTGKDDPTSPVNRMLEVICSESAEALRTHLARITVSELAKGTGSEFV